jgi:hypothetical protein
MLSRVLPVLVGNREGKIPPGGPKCRFEDDDNEVDLKEVDCECLN